MAHPLTKVQDAHVDSIWTVTWCKDRIITGSVDQTVKVWKYVPKDPADESDTENIVQERKFENHALGVISVATTAASNLLATSSMDSRIRLFDLETGSIEKTLECGPVDCWTVSLHPSGKELATGSHTGAVHIWDLETGTLKKSLESRGKFILSVAFSASGELVAGGARDGAVYVFDVESGRLVSTLQGHSMPVRCLAFSPDGKTLFTGADDGLVFVYGTTNFNLLSKLMGHLSHINALAVSPDNRYLVTAAADKKVKVWDLEAEPSPNCTATFENHSDSVFGLCFNETGTRFVSVSGDKSIQLYAMPKV